MSRLLTTTEADWLPIPHAGDLLKTEFMEPLELGCGELAEAIATEPARLHRLIDGTSRIDGEMDLRLTRYFRMTEGFFLRLQDSYELRIAKRHLNRELDRIVPRAA